MNLEALSKWCKEMQSEIYLAKLVRRDAQGRPIRNDIHVARSLVTEILRRIDLIQEYQNKIINYETNIGEYLNELYKRNIKYLDDMPSERQEPVSAEST